MDSVRYMPVADISVASICLVLLVLVQFSFVRNSRAFRIFLAIVVTLALSALSNVVFNLRLQQEVPDLLQDAYVLRCVYHGLLFMVFILFSVYVSEVSHARRSVRYMTGALSVGIYVTVLVLDALQAIQRVPPSLMIDDIDITVLSGFTVGYLAFSTLLVLQMYSARNRLYRKVILGFFGTIAVSFIVLSLQTLHRQSSYTAMTFLYPVIGMFYFMHSNPYDVELGALDRQVLDDHVRANYEQNRAFMFISIYLSGVANEGRSVPKEATEVTRRFTESFFRSAVLVRVDKGHLVLLFPKDKNIGYGEGVIKGTKLLKDTFERLGLDYKLVIGSSIDDISRKGAYVNLIENIHRVMGDNTTHRVSDEDVARYRREELVLLALADIHRRGDLDDGRVLAYCQPVLNVRTGRYDTAEALMRMKLEGVGMVYPNEFIPLAERAGHIHVLTKIILHKTCSAISDMIAKGYEIQRISVNVSVVELADANFCDDITKIVDKSGIPGDKIAIELTESQSDSDFRIMKSRIGELKERGIKFYLDDFGTGYSSMERIMALPFDIIKFDRSLVLASDASERSRKIVVGLADIFSAMNYAVLFEGVEEQAEEEMCIDMRASYLQGYRYSKPIPIEELTDYFDGPERAA